MFSAFSNYFITPLVLIVSIILALAFLTLAERKIIGSIQLRKGPNVIHTYGLLQPFADGLKLFTKEPIHPLTSSFLLFLFTPLLALTIALLL